MLTLEEICDTIERLCNPGVPPETHRDVDPTLVRRSAEQLLQLSCVFTSAQSSSTKASGSGDVACHGTVDLDGSDALTATLAVTHPHRCVVRHCCLVDTLVALGNTVSCDWSVARMILILVFTSPYYVCISYHSWFIDEKYAIYANPDARGETPILQVLKHDFWGMELDGLSTHKSWRPLITLLFAVEWRLATCYGWLDVVMQAMRFLSCLIHSFNSLLVLRLLRRLRIGWQWSLLGASLFATHPIHVENIVYLVGRADALATTFYLLTVLCYLNGTFEQRSSLRVRSYIALTVLTVVAGLCKETGFTALFFLACAEVVLRQRCRHVFGFLICFVAVGYLRVWYVRGTSASFGFVDTPVAYQESKLTRTLTYLYQHAYYAKLLVLPWNQSWDYSYDALPMLETFVDVRILAIVGAYLAVVGLGAAGLKRRREQPTICLGVALIIIPFVPASNLFFLVGTTVGERLLYTSSAGWALLVVSTLPPPAAALAPVRRPRFVGLVVLLMLYIYNSSVRMWQWRSKATLFEGDAEHWGQSAKVLHHKAIELQERGDLHGALDYFKRSLEVFDDTALTDYCIARILLCFGLYDEALERFLKIQNGHRIGFYKREFLWITDFGYLLVKLERFQEGARLLQAGLRSYPLNCFAWNALAVAQSMSDELEHAEQSLSEAIRCDPSSCITWNNLAVVYSLRNSGQQALQALQHALTLNASHPIIRFNALVFTGQAKPSAQPVFEIDYPCPT